MQLDMSVHGQHCICHVCTNERAADAERQRRQAASRARSGTTPRREPAAALRLAGCRRERAGVRLLAAVRAELGAEETRRQQTTGKLREIERLALELDGDHAQVEPTEKTPQQRGRPRAAAKRRQSRPAPKGANAARVLHALGEGPVRASELARRAKVPKGSITGVLEQLARDGKVNRPAERGGGWTLASPRGPTPKDHERGTVPVLIGRVLEVVSHERLGTAGIARELDEPVAEVARALAELDQKGDVRRSGEVWEAAW